MANNTANDIVWKGARGLRAACRRPVSHPLATLRMLMRARTQLCSSCALVGLLSSMTNPSLPIPPHTLDFHRIWASGTLAAPAVAIAPVRKWPSSSPHALPLQDLGIQHSFSLSFG